MNVASSSLNRLQLGNLWLVFLVMAAAATAVNAQTFTTLASFNYSASGSGPYPIVQGLDGNLYGVTWEGVGMTYGSIFQATTSGEFKTLYQFCSLFTCLDGESPIGPLVPNAMGILYGTTMAGGGYSDGEIFQIGPGGVSTLHSFDISDGRYPSGLVLAADRNLYGTTASGGAYNSGSIFRLSPKGQFTTLYSFCAQTSCPDGYGPQQGLTQGTDGALYGFALGGKKCGSGNPCGSIFRISPSGKFTTVLDFPAGGLQGWSPTPGSLLQTPDGKLYGSTEDGGVSGVWGGGTIFKISPDGKFTTVYNLCSLANCSDGSFGANFVLATDGNFYGTTQDGGDLTCPATFRVGCGTVFKMTPTGTLTTLHIFEGPDGALPVGLIQATDGNFYGVAQTGGATSNGTLFRLSAGLGPFVKLLPASGKLGQTGDILGQGLTGTSAVSFNGLPASFTVVSDTLIHARVPAGATTGPVTVVTPAGTLTSNVPFQVLP